MADTTAAWPIAKFLFTVTGLPSPASFQEVTGLEAEVQVIEYRSGDSTTFSPTKSPGLAKVGNVTLKKGIFANDDALLSWFNTIYTNSTANVPRSTVVISLNDESNAPKMTWTLNQCFPVKLTGTDLKSDGNEVAVESIELAYETLVVAKV